MAPSADESIFCHDQEADIGAAGFTITQVRESVVDFTIPYYIEPTAILLPRAKSGSKTWSIFRPLSPTVTAYNYRLIIK
jgi:ABC-type amino acid transport substrate-binding protein